MNNNEFISVFNTYNKEHVDKIANALKSLNIKMRIKTSTESLTKETIYELLVLEESLGKAHELILEIQQKK